MHSPLLLILCGQSVRSTHPLSPTDVPVGQAVVGSRRFSHVCVFMHSPSRSTPLSQSVLRAHPCLVTVVPGGHILFLVYMSMFAHVCSLGCGLQFPYKSIPSLQSESNWQPAVPSFVPAGQTLSLARFSHVCSSQQVSPSLRYPGLQLAHLCVLGVPGSGQLDPVAPLPLSHAHSLLLHVRSVVADGAFDSYSESEQVRHGKHMPTDLSVSWGNM